MRIDTWALLFTWRQIAKMKNSVNTNLLVLDEIFDSSLDAQGTDDFFKIIKTMTKENIFIISHKGDIMFDKFTNIVKFEKYNPSENQEPGNNMEKQRLKLILFDPRITINREVL